MQAGAVATKGALGDACAGGYRERSGMAYSGARVLQVLSAERFADRYFPGPLVSRDPQWPNGAGQGQCRASRGTIAPEPAAAYAPTHPDPPGLPVMEPYGFPKEVAKSWHAPIDRQFANSIDSNCGL